MHWSCALILYTVYRQCYCMVEHTLILCKLTLVRLCCLIFSAVDLCASYTGCMEIPVPSRSNGTNEPIKGSDPYDQSQSPTLQPITPTHVYVYIAQPIRGSFSPMLVD
ncbi:hypothetical protein XENTR_v10004959 [Xenopus tropicalis]|nr:hypothetical protein XENTR_v10004959 [Xenopus tropicalis]